MVPPIFKVLGTGTGSAIHMPVHRNAADPPSLKCRDHALGCTTAGPYPTPDLTRTCGLRPAAAGLLACGLLLACWPAAGLLADCCWPAAGDLLLACLWPAAPGRLLLACIWPAAASNVLLAGCCW